MRRRQYRSHLHWLLATLGIAAAATAAGALLIADARADEPDPTVAERAAHSPEAGRETPTVDGRPTPSLYPTVAPPPDYPVVTPPVADYPTAAPGTAPSGEPQPVATLHVGQHLEATFPPVASVRTGSRLFLVEHLDWSSDTLPAWAFVGEVVDDQTDVVATLHLPTDIMWRLTPGDIGLAIAEPLRDGEYLLVTAGWQELGRVDVQGTVATGLVPLGEPVELSPEEEPILEPDGLAGVGFGTHVDEALAALTARFGEPLDDSLIEDYLVVRVVRWANGIAATFDDRGFVSYQFRAEVGPHGTPLDPAVNPRPPFTTPDGLGLYDALPRSGAFEFWGGFEQLFGSNVWYQGWDFGGWLSGDVSDPTSVVLAIDAGIDGPLASLTCAC